MVADEGLSSLFFHRLESVVGWKGSCQTVAVLYSEICVAIRRFSSSLYMKVYDFQIAFELCVDAMLAA